MAARGTTGQSGVASAQTGPTGSNGQTKRKRRRRIRREANGRRNQIEAGSAQRGPVRKSEPGDSVVRFKVYELQMRGRAVDWNAYTNAPLLLSASNTVSKTVVFGWEGHIGQKDRPRLTHGMDRTDLEQETSFSSLSLSLFFCVSVRTHRVTETVGPGGPFRELQRDICAAEPQPVIT